MLKTIVQAFASALTADHGRIMNMNNQATDCS